jgi:hypothetical protein
MGSPKGWFVGSFSIGFFSLAVFLAVVPLVLAQGAPPGGSGDSPRSDTSRTPFRIQLSGFINTQPEEGSRVLTLGINAFGENYQFELIKAEALDDQQIGEYAIIQQVGKYAVDFNLVGSRNLLSKVGQAEPGTPLRLVGFFTQRDRKLQLESVEVIGLNDQSAPLE